MASIRVILCVTIVVLFAVFQIGSSVKCFECHVDSTTTDKKCSDTNNGTENKDCKDKCLKINDADGNVWERKCGSDKECKVYADCLTCTTDLCNSSPTILPTFLTLGVVSVVFAKYFY